MNRLARRSLAASLRAEARQPVHNGSVRLVDGPMDGWVVTPDAPALAPTWWETWPVDVAMRHKPGRYVVDRTSARWVTDA